MSLCLDCDLWVGVIKYTDQFESRRREQIELYYCCFSLRTVFPNRSILTCGHTILCMHANGQSLGGLRLLLRASFVTVAHWLAAWDTRIPTWTYGEHETNIQPIIVHSCIIVLLLGTWRSSQGQAYPRHSCIFIESLGLRLTHVPTNCMYWVELYCFIK